MAQPFHGTYADLKVIKGRKVAQLIIEMPLEAGDKFVKDYGLPNPAEEVWFAVAQLDMSKKPGEQDEPDRRRWDQISAPQQAGMRCSEPGFWRFIQEGRGIACQSADIAAAFVRDYCDVDSRSALKSGTAAEAAWLRLDGEYLAWRYSS